VDTDVIIVGGGAAGIAAARRLASSGLTTLLIEASARLGGRGWTEEILDLEVDLGCGWLHSAERNPWARIAEEVGIPVDRSRAQWGIQYRDLGFPKTEQAEARQAMEAWMKHLETQAEKNDCAADALDPASPWNDYIRSIVGFISGGKLEQLSAKDYLAYDEASSENNWRVRSGMGALIASSFPANVLLRVATPVQEIALHPNGVRLRLPADSIRARAVILTVSTAVLAGDALQLPTELAPWREAAAALPLGHVEKLFLHVDGGPFEDESQVLGNPRDVRTASYYIRPLGRPLIECFLGGEAANLVKEGGLHAAFDHALEQLSALFGASVHKSLRPLTASNWCQMSHVGGAYSYAIPGRAGARQALAKPFDNCVFFAGEATSTNDFSTAHGAHDSGVRAAEEVIAALK